MGQKIEKEEDGKNQRVKIPNDDSLFGQVCNYHTKGYISAQSQVSEYACR